MKTMLSCKDINPKSRDNNRNKVERDIPHELSIWLRNAIKWDPDLTMHTGDYKSYVRHYSTFKGKQTYIFMTLKGRKEFSNMTENI